MLGFLEAAVRLYITATLVLASAIAILGTAWLMAVALAVIAGVAA